MPLGFGAVDAGRAAVRVAAGRLGKRGAGAAPGGYRLSVRQFRNLREAGYARQRVRRVPVAGTKRPAVRTQRGPELHGHADGCPRLSRERSEPRDRSAAVSGVWAAGQAHGVHARADHGPADGRPGGRRGDRPAGDVGSALRAAARLLREPAGADALAADAVHRGVPPVPGARRRDRGGAGRGSFGSGDQLWPGPGPGVCDRLEAPAASGCLGDFADHRRFHRQAGGDCPGRRDQHGRNHRKLGQETGGGAWNRGGLPGRVPQSVRGTGAGPAARPAPEV